MHFVAKVIDHLDADAAVLRAWEGSRDRGIQLGPGGFIDFGFQGAFEPIVGIVADEIGLADEKTVLVVIVIDESGGNVVHQLLAA